MRRMSTRWKGVKGILKVKKDEKDEIDVKDVQLRIGCERREGW